MGRRTKKDDGVTRTVVAVIQDRSGSMSGRREATVSGYNEYIQGLKKEAGEIRVTLTQFNTAVENVYTSTPIADVKEFTFEDYVPGGMTALYDAVGNTVRALESSIRKSDKVLVVIMTDGAENSSREWRHDAILKLFEDKRKEGWEFIFLGAGEEAWDVGMSLGFDAQQTITYSGVDANAHKRAFGEVLRSTSSVHSGSTAQAYLSSSPVKADLEEQAKQEKKARRFTHSSK